MIIHIDYDEPDTASYREVVARLDNNETRFATGDVVADFAAAMRYAQAYAKFGFPVMLASACDQFVMDSDGEYGWIEAEYGDLITRGDKTS